MRKYFGVMCTFCYTNGEPPSVYESHHLREDFKLTCPILRAYVCPTCNATGDDAHTKTYCPITIAKDGGRRKWPMVQLLKIKDPEVWRAIRARNFFK